MSEIADSISTALDLDEAVEITRDLVRAESENPPGNERAAADAALPWLEKVGCTSIREVEEIPGRPSVIADWGSSDGPVMVFNGHIDVVPSGDPASWSHPPYEAVVEDGKIYGRGTTDMKSGIAAMIESIAILGRLGFEPAGSVQFQLVADEESFGTHGTDFMLREGLLRGDAGIVSEPTSLMVGLGERGAYWATITAKGRAVHGSVPEQGVSAIEKIARATLALHKREFEMTDPLLGRPSLNVGVIEGGSKINVVADNASISIDRRSIPGETRESVEAEILGVLESIAAEDPEFEYELDVFGFAEPSVIERDAEIVSLLASSIERHVGGPPDFYGSPGATDARFMRNQAGIPTVVFGPGIMGLAHTIDEYVEIDAIGVAAKVYADVVAQFLG